MRFLKIDILVLSMLLVGLLIGGVANAKTYNFTFEANMRSDPNDPNSAFDVPYMGTDLSMGREVEFSLFGSSPVGEGLGINFFTMGFTFDDLLFDYGTNWSSAIPQGSGPDSTPTYILYAPAAGSSAANLLYPTPAPFQFIPASLANPRPINVSWVNLQNLSPSLTEFAPDAGTLIAKLILTARSGASASVTASEVHITFTDTLGAILRVDDIEVVKTGGTLPTDPNTFLVTVQDAITINVPEPTTAGLSIAALAALVAIRIRRGRVSA